MGSIPRRTKLNMIVTAGPRYSLRVEYKVGHVNSAATLSESFPVADEDDARNMLSTIASGNGWIVVSAKLVKTETISLI